MKKNNTSRMSSHTSANEHTPPGIHLLDLAADTEGIFLERPNRFRALVQIQNARSAGQYAAHVHDPGRLRELLYPGNPVLLRHARDTSKRKTAWDVLAARSPAGWTLIHSGFHRPIMERIFRHRSISPFPDPIAIKPEIRFGSSRLDFLIEITNTSQIAVETKGCSLVELGTALFPDAPTTRGTRHMNELIQARLHYGRSAVCVLVTNPSAHRFAPFAERDPEFTDTFFKALSNGVEASAHVVEYNGRSVRYLRDIPILDRISAFNR